MRNDERLAEAIELLNRARDEAVCAESCRSASLVITKIDEAILWADYEFRTGHI